ncbi:aminoglycoside phosphotransferase family protein [Roseobacter sp. CCS2]|uniref:aminoglycoside phosphotransferase family protein n=1 Tax=Roseobacter sp. CCS2 TaxID=391593 RepID=UPI0000F40306|nr:aminoglycoside phosphotransferase family protein [Roseobacter sp. CCS2]EBA13148.1 hypothetical protein RCCS2_04664 [Roseobacter sp. CCS2]
MATARTNQSPQTQDLIERAEKIAARWNVHLDTPLKHTADRLVYKVSTADGNAVLKLNRKLGSEGGAVPFLRGLPDGIGVQLLRVSPLRRAVLLDWLEGPTLEECLAEGRATEAETHLAKLASALAQASFRYAFTLPKLETWLMRRFTRCAKGLQNTPHHQNLTRSMRLFEKLVQTTQRQTVIHGDLDFNNAILTQAGPRLIDPKGFRADPAAEFHRALVKRPSGPTVQDFINCIQHRAAVFAPAINETPQRVIQWGAVMRANQVLFHHAGRAAADRADPHLTAYLDLAEG